MNSKTILLNMTFSNITNQVSDAMIWKLLAAMLQPFFISRSKCFVKFIFKHIYWSWKIIFCNFLTILTIHIVPGYAWYNFRGPLFINSVRYNIKQTWTEREALVASCSLCGSCMALPCDNKYSHTHHQVAQRWMCQSDIQHSNELLLLCRINCDNKYFPEHAKYYRLCQTKVLPRYVETVYEWWAFYRMMDWKQGQNIWLFQSTDLTVLDFYFLCYIKQAGVTVKTTTIWSKELNMQLSQTPVGITWAIKNVIIFIQVCN